MAKRKRKRKPIPAKKTLRNMADRLWSLAVRGDWNWQCAMCGFRKVEAHHLIPRQHESTRYDLYNGIALCARHHQFCPERAPHQNPAGFMVWLQSTHANVHGLYLRRTESPPRFTGTKNEVYYCDVIRGLRQYVEESAFEEIVGVRFSKWLEENE